MSRAIFALLFSCACAAAQPVTIDDAVREATEKNLSLVAERMNIPIAQARIITARLRPNPVLTLGADYLNLFAVTSYADRGYGPAEPSGRVDYLFERGHKREYRAEVAEASKSVVELNVLNTIRGIILDVENAF